MSTFEQSREWREIMIIDTATFRRALEVNPADAEAWLDTIRQNRGKYSQYDDRWLDHREQELFQAFCKTSDWPAAKRVVEATEDPHSKEGRERRLVILAGTPYEEI